MRKLLLLLALFCSLGTSAQSNDLSWYKLLKGKIDQYGITMHLHKAGHEYSGYYYYDTQQQPVYVGGEDTSKKGKIRLIAWTGGEEVEVFELAISGNTVSGQWRKTENGRPLAVSATALKAALPFTYIFTKGSVKLRPKMKDSPMGTYEEASVWPLENSPHTAAMKKILTSGKNQDIGPMMLENKKAFFASYKEEHRDVSDQEIKEGALAYSQEEIGRTMIMYQAGKLMVLASYGYTYLGGAHGMYGTSYECIDLSRYAVLKLEDVVTGKPQDIFPKLIEKYFRKQYGVKAGTSLEEAGLLTNAIELTDNFFLTTRGISFCYYPYEIGSYAMGQIEIFIPYSDIEKFMKPDFRNLLQ